MEIRQVEAFVSVATLRNFRAAANRLHITQPAVSLRLAALEAELGVKLLDRSGAEVQLTTKGLQLLQHAEQLLDMSQKLKTLASGTQAVHQKLRIGTTSTIVTAWLARLVEEIRHDLPALNVELHIETSPRLRTLLLEGELDIAIIMGPTHAAGIRNLPLKSYKTQWVASRKLKLPASMSLEQLALHPLVTYARDSATYGSIEELFRSRGLWPVQLSSSNSTEAIIRIAEKGLAIGVVSAACLDGDVDTSQLHIIKCEAKLPSYEYMASYHLDSAGHIGMIVAGIAQRVCRGKARAASAGRIAPNKV